MSWIEHLKGLAEQETNIGKKVAFETSAENIDELERENRILKAGIAAVRNLINESYGVDGLHKNGDIAAWDELEQGGRFGEWLSDFNEAEGVQQSDRDARRVSRIKAL